MQSQVAPAAVMFVCYAVVAALAVQPEFRLCAESPRTLRLESGGLLAAFGKMLGLSHLSHGALTAVYFVLIAVLFAAYVWAILLVWKKKKQAGRLLIYGFFMAFSLWVLFLPPLLSQDAFNYIFYGRALAVYGKNPLLAVPSAFPADPALPYVGWREAASVYGPISNYVGAVTVLVCGKGLMANVIGFKLVNFGFLAGSLLVLDSLASRMMGERGRLAVLIVAWNPLLIIHFAGSVHHDTIMVFFIILGLLLLRKGYSTLAVASITLAALVKPIALFVLVPVLVLMLRENAKRPMGEYLRALGVMVILPLVSYMPLWSGLRHNVEQVTGMGGSYSSSSIVTQLGNTTKELVRMVGIQVGDAACLDLYRYLFYAIFLVLFFYFCYRIRDYESLVYACGAIALVSVFTMPYVMPWYVGWVLFLIVLTDRPVWTGAAIGASAAMCCYAWMINHSSGVAASIMLMVIAAGLIAMLLLDHCRKKWGSEALAGEH